MAVTVSTYARHRGVSRRAVYHALEAGRITRAPDGSIDPAVADQDWRDKTSHVGGKRQGAAQTARRRRGTAFPASEVAKGEAEARRLLGRARGAPLSFADARRARELVKLAREGLELRRLQDDTWSRAEVQDYVFTHGRYVRDAILNLPAREAGPGAADLGVDERRLAQWLAGVLHRFCQDQADAAFREADVPDERRGEAEQEGATE